MNIEMAYLLGAILGNGEVQRGSRNTTITIEIPYKNLWTEDKKDIAIYTKASILDIKTILDPLVGKDLTVTESMHNTRLSFTKNNDDYTMRELMRFIGRGTHHRNMQMNKELFDMSIDEKKSLLRGFADTTGYIRRSNRGRNPYEHRVYLEVPENWNMVIDICNLLRDVDVPVETIDFGHPNFRDGKVTKYNEGNKTFWKKEHQIKIYANEFLAIGFNISHKQECLIKFAEEQMEFMNVNFTHRFYWEKRKTKPKEKPHHPEENSCFLPENIRGKHYDSWKQLARELGYHEKR